MGPYGRDYRFSGRGFGYGRRDFGAEHERDRFAGDRFGHPGASRGGGRSIWHTAWEDRPQGYDAGFQERTGFGSGGYDRDLGDRVREGWHGLRNGMRRTFGSGYDRGFSRGDYSARMYDRGWRW